MAFVDKFHVMRWKIVRFLGSRNWRVHDLCKILSHPICHSAFLLLLLNGILGQEVTPTIFISKALSDLDKF